jgi:hypothetical protein
MNEENKKYIRLHNLTNYKLYDLLTKKLHDLTNYKIIGKLIDCLAKEYDEYKNEQMDMIENQP